MVERKLFERLSKDARTPAWQVAALHCWANVDRRGHCPMPRGFLTELLGKRSDVDTRKVVETAVQRGWLAAGSNDRCMIAPHGIEYKVGNYNRRPCCEFH